MFAALSLMAVLAGALCLALLPIAERVARRLGLLAYPGGRHVHALPTPLAGASVLVSVAILVGPVLAFHPQVGLILAGAGALCLLGVIDDRRPVPAAVKLAVQALVCAGVVSAGLGGRLLELPLVGALDLGGARVPVLALFLVFTINALNLLDGLDGLAPGVALISSLTLMVLSLGTGHPEIALVCAALAGASGGFLSANLRGRIFLGDQGSLVLGFLLGACALAGLGKTGATVSLVPVLVLALPLMDAGAVTLARLRAGISPWRADRRHLHHRLLRQGLTPAAVRWRLWGIAAACGLYAVIVERTGVGHPSAGLGASLAVGLLGMVVLSVLAGMILRAGRARARAAAASG